MTTIEDADRRAVPLDGMHTGGWHGAPDPPGPRGSPVPTGPSSPTIPHLRALDGLRGVAVALVVVYHFAPQVLPGGFLGVDVFFVLSGFLITSLILVEVRDTGRLAVRAFYVRRLRRLLPALLLVVAVLALYAWWWATPGELDRLREHALWTLGYLANWRFVIDGTTYTDLVAGQSPLRHTWSLAIEEQFYVVFPALVVALGALVGWRSGHLRRTVLWVGVVGAAASAVWMAVLWGDGSDPSRGYYGTDTRAHSLLVGVALGAVLLGRPPTEGRAARVAALTAIVGGIVLVVAVMVGQEDSAGLQRGGFLLVALAVAGVIAGLRCVRWLRRLLEVPALVGLGVISYGVYLWHWPVLVLVDEDRVGVDGSALLVLRLALTIGLALASFVLLERPIRHGALGRRLHGGAPLAVAATVAVVVVGVVLATRPATPPRQLVTAAGPPPGFVMPTTTSSAPVPSTEPATSSTPPSEVPSTSSPTTADAAGAAAPSSSSSPAPSSSTAPPPPREAVILGDSVAHSLAGGWVGEFPDFQPWSPAQSPFDPARMVVRSLARPACSFLPGRILASTGDTADLSSFCGDWRAEVDAKLGAQPTDYLVLALANDNQDRVVDGAEVDLGTPEHDRLLVALLDEVRERSARHGTELVLVALPPRVGVFIADEDQGGVRESMMRDRYLAYARSRPGVRFLDLFETLCPAADCSRPPKSYDPAYRYDGTHFNGDGARWVAAWMTELLAPAPR
jgi:peptidoglycan/LPS O-acetylase OafA/YrhL